MGKVRLRIVPNAKRDEVVGTHGDAIKIKVHAPAMDGKANAALLEFLAECIGEPERTLRLTQGEKSRDKTVEAETVSDADFRERLLASVPGARERSIVVQASSLPLEPVEPISRPNKAAQEAAEQKAPQKPAPLCFERGSSFTYIKSRGELPHLYPEGGSFFITFRLRDAVAPKGRKPESQSADAEETLSVMERCEPPLRVGSCVLAKPEVATIVAEALAFFAGKRYFLHAWCIMPNHVHVVMTPYGKHRVPDIVHSWKSFTAKKINRILNQTGTLWERESFDHWIRCADTFDAFVRYTEQNPVTAGLSTTAQEWPFSSANMAQDSNQPSA